MSGKGRNGYIYLIRDQRTGLTKIGFSENPRRRLHDLTRESTLLPEPLSFEIAEAFKGTLAEEHRLHRIFESRRVRGEWFDLCFWSFFEICDNFDARDRMPGREWFRDGSSRSDPFEFTCADAHTCPCPECVKRRRPPIAYANVRYF